MVLEKQYNHIQKNKTRPLSHYKEKIDQKHLKVKCSEEMQLETLHDIDFSDIFVNLCPAARESRDYINGIVSKKLLYNKKTLYLVDICQIYDICTSYI